MLIPYSSNPMAKLIELDSFPNNLTCVFCKQSKNDEVWYGKIYQYGDIVTHHFCMLFSSKMEQRGEDEDGILGFLPVDIKKELVRGQKEHCFYCRKGGATINCSNKGCKKRYHFPCGTDNGALNEFFDQFRSFCFQHRRSQVVTLKSSEKSTCLMCQEDVKCIPSLVTIWAPCCKTAWFHRLCVQKMALSAGYFFKCPKCNSKDKFREEMLACGIYIPDQDASWELERNAFGELSERPSRCDAEICKCPHGRDRSDADRKWEITLCSLCGSKGIHVHCGKAKTNIKGHWTCDFCASIVSKMAPTVPTPGPSGNRNTRGPRPTRRRRKRQNASQTSGTPPVKTTVVDQTMPVAENENTSCLYASGGQAIPVVKLDNIAPNNGDSVVEIGGVNVGANNVSNVIMLESSDEDEENRESIPPARLSRILSTNCRRSLPTIQRNPLSSSSEPPSLVIDLLDSDDEGSNISEINSRLSSTVDDDREIVFMGCEEPVRRRIEPDPTPAMICIRQNGSNLHFSAPEATRYNAALQNTAVGFAGPSNVMWQSVPRHKSMVHSFQRNSSPSTMTLNRVNESNQMTTSVIQQRWTPKIVPNSGTSLSRGLGPVTSSYVTDVNEVIDLD